MKKGKMTFQRFLMTFFQNEAFFVQVDPDSDLYSNFGSGFGSGWDPATQRIEIQYGSGSEILSRTFVLRIRFDA